MCRALIILCPKRHAISSLLSVLKIVFRMHLLKCPGTDTSEASGLITQTTANLWRASSDIIFSSYECLTCAHADIQSTIEECQNTALIVCNSVNLRGTYNVCLLLLPTAWFTKVPWQQEEFHLKIYANLKIICMQRFYYFICNERITMSCFFPYHILLMLESCYFKEIGLLYNKPIVGCFCMVVMLPLEWLLCMPFLR